jgi:hypothetical protein
MLQSFALLLDAKTDPKQEFLKSQNLQFVICGRF